MANSCSNLSFALIFSNDFCGRVVYIASSLTILPLPEIVASELSSMLAHQFSERIVPCIVGAVGGGPRQQQIAGRHPGLLVREDAHVSRNGNNRNKRYEQYGY